MSSPPGIVASALSKTIGHLRKEGEEDDIIRWDLIILAFGIAAVVTMVLELLSMRCKRKKH